MGLTFEWDLYSSGAYIFSNHFHVKSLNSFLDPKLIKIAKYPREKIDYRPTRRVAYLVEFKLKVIQELKHLSSRDLSVLLIFRGGAYIRVGLILKSKGFRWDLYSKWGLYSRALIFENLR